MGRFGRRRGALSAFAVLIGTVGALAVPAPTRGASGSVFGVAEVVEEVRRQLAAADQGDSPLHIDDASLELALVEGAGSRAGGLAVPGADFSLAGKEDGGRPSLKRRLVLEVAATKGAKPAGGGSGKLTAAIEEVKASVQQAMAAGGGFELKKLTLDFDFAVERDGRGAPSLVVYANDRRIDTPSVQGIKVRFTTKEK